MEEQFKQQSGAARSNPSSFYRWVASLIMTRAASLKLRQHRREKVERARGRSGRAHQIEYFHQVDDPYSHLAAQLLQPLSSQYDVELVPHLVSGAGDADNPEPELLSAYARQDCAAIAPQYGLSFPSESVAPAALQINQATAMLTVSTPADFGPTATSVGHVLWRGEYEQTAEECAAANSTLVSTALERGNARRKYLGHYAGAMFYYGGEWYWGVDRFHHLEQRLRELKVGHDRTRFLAPRPVINPDCNAAFVDLTLECYVSLRSPYSAIIFERCVDMARHSGVTLVLRPVLPMVMRGVPVTRQKGLYIFADAAREASAGGLEWGNIYDPIGDPVRQAYSLFPWARDQGRAVELFGAFFQAAFVDGINTNREKGLRLVVERAGLSWRTARTILGNNQWQDEFERNRVEMYRCGLWGVPSFRLLGADGKQILSTWGQDRLWLVHAAIQDTIGSKD